MGSCFSSPEKELSEKKVTLNSRSRLTTTEQRLGSKEQSNGSTTTGTGAGTAGSKNAPAEGHKLGANDDSMNSGNTSTREAVARAAELRYNQQQEKNKNSQGKLKTMSKMSRQEKGL